MNQGMRGPQPMSVSHIHPCLSSLLDPSSLSSHETPHLPPDRAGRSCGLRGRQRDLWESNINTGLPRALSS